MIFLDFRKRFEEVLIRNTLLSRDCDDEQENLKSRLPDNQLTLQRPPRLLGNLYLAVGNVPTSNRTRNIAANTMSVANNSSVRA
jgi:hypothetical protein